MDNEPRENSSNADLDASDLSSEPLLEIASIEMSPELIEIISALKVSLVHADTPQETLRELWLNFSLQFEALAEQTDNREAYTKVQISAMLQKGIIFRTTGLNARYLEELDKADMYASNEGLETLSAVISAEIDSRVSKLDRGPEQLILCLRGKINDANRTYLWDLWAEEQDYDDVVNHAFETLLDEGENPEEVLGDLGFLEL